MSVNNIPPNLKPLTSYLKTAVELEKRDPVVAYYCRLYAVQRGMELDRSSPDSKKYLMELMDNLDAMKTALKDNESVMSETVGQAHVEEYALKLFAFADRRDREGNFDQATIRSFVTAGFLMDVLGVFGEVGEDIEKCRKYAKWKAVYINQCLKNGETPHPGPLDDDNVVGSGGTDGFSGQNNIQVPPTQPVSAPTAAPRVQKPVQPPAPSNQTVNPAPSTYYSEQPASGSAGAGGSSHLTPEDFAQAEKLCKYAASALQYQDSTTAIDYLSKCLQLLQTGRVRK